MKRLSRAGSPWLWRVARRMYSSRGPVRARRRRVPAEHQAHLCQRQRERAVGRDRLVVPRERRVPQPSPVELFALEERLQRGQRLRADRRPADRADRPAGREHPQHPDAERVGELADPGRLARDLDVRLAHSAAAIEQGGAERHRVPPPRHHGTVDDQPRAGAAPQLLGGGPIGPAAPAPEHHARRHRADRARPVERAGEHVAHALPPDLE